LNVERVFGVGCGDCRSLAGVLAGKGVDATPFSRRRMKIFFVRGSGEQSPIRWAISARTIATADDE